MSRLAAWDIEQISHVFNFDPPEDPEIYVHRIGRTGRVEDRHRHLAGNASRMLALGSHRRLYQATYRQRRLADR